MSNISSSSNISNMSNLSSFSNNSTNGLACPTASESDRQILFLLRYYSKLDTINLAGVFLLWWQDLSKGWIVDFLCSFLLEGVLQILLSFFGVLGNAASIFLLSRWNWEMVKTQKREIKMQEIISKAWDAELFQPIAGSSCKFWSALSVHHAPWRGKHLLFTMLLERQVKGAGFFHYSARRVNYTKQIYALP